MLQRSTPDQTGGLTDFINTVTSHLRRLKLLGRGALNDSPEATSDC